MLRKNKVHLMQGEKCTIGCQTEEFLLYVSMEQKLEEVYHEYRHLQTRYEHANQLIEALKYKNKYLETSLCEISIAFNQNISKNNLHHIQEIRNLDRIISQESQELQYFHQTKQKKSLSVIQQDDKKSLQYHQVVKSENSLPQSRKSSSIDVPSSIIKYRTISAIESFNVEEKHSSCLGQSQNEFLPQMPQSAILEEVQISNNCESQRYQKSLKVSSHYQKYATSRMHVQSKHKKQASIKKLKEGKQNLNYEKLIKIEAQLKMKEFMHRFQMDKRLRPPLESNLTHSEGQQFDFYYENVEEQNQMATSNVIESSR